MMSESERLDFLLRAKPKPKFDSSSDEMFRISDNFTVEIIQRWLYFDIVFWYLGKELDCWIYLRHNNSDIVCHDSSHATGRELFIEDLLTNYPEIFEWVLWHPEIFEVPEKQE